MLLDLLGGPDPRIPSYFQATHWAYEGMARAEQRLRSLGLLKTEASRPFLPETGKAAARFARGGYVLDDHVPFMQRGVPVLHIIPTPFPPVWHRIEDDGEHLDPAALEDWAKIVTAFVAEWMELDGVAEPESKPKAEPAEEKEMFELQRQLLLTFLASRGRGASG